MLTPSKLNALAQVAGTLAEWLEVPTADVRIDETSHPDPGDARVAVGTTA